MEKPDPRSPTSVGFSWASRITGLSIGFVVPALVGVFLDRKLGSSPWGVVVGSALGFLVGMVQLLRIARGDRRA